VARTQAVFYRDRDGGEPVDAFIETLPVPAQVAIDNMIGRLNGLDPAAPPLAFPHSSQIEGELRELRCHYGRDLYRILYRRSDNLFILLHAFAKRSRTLSDADRRIARERWDDFQSRIDAEPRRPPRPLGHDAP
jgi:phage-related protein